MLYTDFCNEFNVCIEKGDYETANQLISRELGASLAKRRSDFVSLLKGSGIPASIFNSDIELVNKFVENVPYNNKLRVGAALLVNSENQEIGFDGKKQINKENVRNCYRVMTNQYKNERHSNLAADPVSAIAQGVGELSKLGTTALQGKQQKRGAGLDYAKSKDAQRAEMLKSLADKKKAESESKSKSNRLLMIVGGSLLGIVVLGVTFYKLKKK
jgi:hypothetical protein